MNIPYQLLRCLWGKSPDYRYTPKHYSNSISFELSISEGDWLSVGDHWEKELQEGRLKQSRPSTQTASLQFEVEGSGKILRRIISERERKERKVRNLLRMKFTQRTKVSCCATCQGADWSRCLKERVQKRSEKMQIQNCLIPFRNGSELIPSSDFQSCSTKATTTTSSITTHSGWKEEEIWIDLNNKNP